MNADNSDKSEPIGVLKTLWKRDPAGKWAIHSLQGIDLKPRKGDRESYFRIAEDFQVLTNRPGTVFENLFSTFGGAQFLVQQSVVPIVAWNEGDAEIKCIGTGFFISASGLLISAGHVLRDPIDEGYGSLTPAGNRTYRPSESLHFGVIIPVNPAMRNFPLALPNEALRNAKFVFYPFEWAEHWGSAAESPLLNQKPDFRLQLDVAVFKVKHNEFGGSFQPLNIGPHRLNIGDRAVAIGYAEMKNISRKPGSDTFPELLISVGAVRNIYPDNITVKQTPTPGPCFDFDALIPGKMSGGPILVGSGAIAKGVVSRSWQGDRFATGCLIAPMMDIKLAGAGEKSIRELMTTGNEGIAIVAAGGI